MERRIRQEIEGGRLHLYDHHVLDRRAHRQDHTAANATVAVGNPNVAPDLTRAELSIRRDVWNLVRCLRSASPDLAKAYVQQTSQVGARESRQIVGPYVLTGQDVVQGRKFEDSIARGSWHIDIHCPMGDSIREHLCVAGCPKGEDCPYWAAEHERMFGGHESPPDGDWALYSRAKLQPPGGDWYDIPYRCLLSLEVPNLLSSGRSISATHEGMASCRVMGTCVALGQAAGTAAALAVIEGVSPGDLDVGDLQASLREEGQLV